MHYHFTTALALVWLSPIVGFAQDLIDPEDAVAFLGQVQARSLETGREYCGYFVLRGDQIVATRPKRGRVYECLASEPQTDDEVIASYHTHGSFSEDADSEVPSVDDLLGDREEGVDGYIVTPGGRVWFHDVQTGVVEQICGTGCVLADPEHDDALFEPIRQRYTLQDLKERFSEE